MNELNFQAIDELYKIGRETPQGVNENFYWAVHGNWKAIREILKAHFANVCDGDNDAA